MTLSAPPIGLRLRDSLTFPVLMKEMRSRMRGARAPILLFITTALVALVACIVVVPQWDNISGDMRSFNLTSASLGRQLFTVLTMLEALIIGLMTPGLTAGVITLEKEQESLPFLLLTRLSSSNIALGKLLSAVSFAIIVLLCGLPVMSIAFLLGGVAPVQVVLSTLVILALIFGFGAIGLACSARCLRTGTAVALTYAICLAWVGLLPLLAWLLRIFNASSGHGYSYYGYSYSYSEGGVCTVLLVSAGLLLLLATVPTVVISSAITLIRHRRPERVTIISIWGVFAALACLLLYLPGAMEMLNTEYFLVANPVVALTQIIDWGSNDYSLAGSGRIFGLDGDEAFSVFSAIGLLALGGWLGLMITVRELQRMRG